MSKVLPKLCFHCGKKPAKWPKHNTKFCSKNCAALEAYEWSESHAWCDSCQEWVHEGDYCLHSIMPMFTSPAVQGLIREKPKGSDN
jgi:hypothetical protein